MIAIIDGLLSSSKKGYDILDKHTRKPGDCKIVADAVNINEVVGTSLKMLVKKIMKMKFW